MSKKDNRVSLARFKELIAEQDAEAGRVLVAKAMPIEVSKGCFPWLDDEDKEIQPVEGALDFIASTGAVDREGDVIDPNGWMLENFRRGGAFLWAHDSSLPPIGKPLNVGVKDGKLMLRVQFTPADMDHPLGKGFGDTIRRMYEEGYMRAVSVGFGPQEVELAEDRDDGGWLPMNFVRQELHEVSAVPVPANPEALHVAESKGINVGHLYNWAEEVKACGMSSEALAWADKTWASKLLDSYQSKAVSVPHDAEQPEVGNTREMEDVIEEPEAPTVEETVKAIEEIEAGPEDIEVVPVEAEPEPAEVVEAVEPEAVEEPAEALETTIACEYEEAVTKSAEVEGRVFEELHKLAAMVAKQGRVLSASNERKLREAFDLLSSVLDAVKPAEEEEAKAVEPCAGGCGCGCETKAPAEPERDGLSEDEFRALIKRSVENKLSAFKAEITGQLAE